MVERAPFPKEMLEQIGRVAVNWNKLEQLINALLSRVLGKSASESPVLAIFAHMSFSPKLEILSTLVDEKGPVPNGHPLSDFKDLASSLREASRLRNKVIHSFYRYEHEAVTMFSVSARGRLKIKKEIVTIESLTQDADRIASITGSVRRLVRAMSEPDSSTPQTGQ